jgi:hypothetical protein
VTAAASSTAAAGVGRRSQLCLLLLLRPARLVRGLLRRHASPVGCLLGALQQTGRHA